MAGRGSKPGERRGGRQKGTPNKLTQSLKDMILGALNKAGGEAYLIKQADKNPVAFMTLLGKVLPTVVDATVENNVTITLAERRAKAREALAAAFSDEASNNRPSAQLH